MSSPARAIFLSYAREDTDAARRIADALRSQGVEVWFDQNELRGGDAWDAKIRKQIDECTLFLPIISAHTQERSKGYFRLEWKLAVEQTHLMAEGRAFLAPVAIDETPEGAALVPPEFLRVQWMRLPGALPTPAFVGQVKRLLDGKVGPVSDRPIRASDPTEAGQRPARPRSAFPRWTWGTLTAVVVAIATAVWVSQKHSTPPAPTPTPVPAVSPAAAPVDDKSIAVLPFENMSEDKDNAYFAEGVHEDILTNLSFIRDLRVVSRTSVMQYRNTTKPISQIARELKVAYVLEGSVRRAGSKIRVTGQLIRAASDEHVWAKAYDRDVADVFAVQSELAQAIAAALQAVIAPETKALLDRRPTENSAAYDAYLKARQLLALGGMQDEEKIIGLLQQAVQLDPGFADAWALLGSRHAFAYFNRDRSAGRLAQAQTAIDTAVHLAPDAPEVIEDQGDFLYYAHRDYAGATEQYQRLARLRPNDPVVFASLGYIARRQGRLPDALANMRHALRLDPDLGTMAGELASTLAACRLYDESIAVGRRYLQKHPDHLFVAAAVAQSEYALHGTPESLRAFAQRSVAPEDHALFLYLQEANARLLGDWPEAIRLDHVQRYFDADTDTPRFMQDVFAAATLAEAGDLPAARTRAAEAVAVMNAELARQPSSPVLWANLGFAHGLLGEKDDALRCAAKARELLPESLDGLQGPVISAMSASTLAWAGEKEQALAEFQRLLHVPYGVNAVFERGIALGSWKPLRDDPRFQALLNDPKNNQPLF